MPVAHHTRSMAAPALCERSGRSATPGRHLSPPLAKCSQSRSSVGRHQHHFHGPLLRAMAYVAAVVEEDMSTGIAPLSPQLSRSASAGQGVSGSVQPFARPVGPVVAATGDSLLACVHREADGIPSPDRVVDPTAGAPGEDILAVPIGLDPEETSSPAGSIHHVNIQLLAEDDEVEDSELLAPPIPRVLRLNPLPAVAEILPRDNKQPAPDDADPPPPLAAGDLQLDGHLAGAGQVIR